MEKYLTEIFFKYVTVFWGQMEITKIRKRMISGEFEGVEKNVKVTEKYETPPPSPPLEGRGERRRVSIA